MVIGYALVVVGGVAFAAGLTLESTWLLAPGLVLLPAGLVWGISR